MSLSAPQTAVLLGLADLEDEDGAGYGWEPALILAAAREYPGGGSVTNRTMESLRRRCLVFWGDDEFTLTESGRRRIRTLR